MVADAGWVPGAWIRAARLPGLGDAAAGDAGARCSRRARALLSASARVVPCRADHDRESALTFLIPARLAREPPVALNLGGADETRSLLKTFAASSWACLRSRPVDAKKALLGSRLKGVAACDVRQGRTFGYDLLKVSRDLFFFRHCAGSVTDQ